MTFFTRTILLLALLPGAAFAQELFDPPGLLLTWQRDPLTTMTIDWHSLASDERNSALHYREVGVEQWYGVEGATHPFPFSDRVIHRVELVNLEPGTIYEFRFGYESRVFRFRTMPADLVEPLRIAIGGDVRHTKTMMERTNRVAMQYDPDFIMWGGDMAYADGREDRVNFWYEWFDAIKNTLIDADGRVVPVIGAVGNHELPGGSFFVHNDFEHTDEARANLAPYFFAHFAFPGQPGYNVLDFGKYLSVIALDSYHLNPVEGAQTEWLESVLSARQDVLHVFPMYHVPGYPSVRSFDGPIETQVRAHWLPLFDRYGIRFAFEHNDHVYKRTHPIRGGVVDPRGVVYLGDGAWGVSVRDHLPVEETWYLANAASKRHFILATLQGRHVSFTVIDETGEIIDSYPEHPLATR